MEEVQELDLVAAVALGPEAAGEQAAAILVGLAQEMVPEGLHHRQFGL